MKIHPAFALAGAALACGCAHLQEPAPATAAAVPASTVALAPSPAATPAVPHPDARDQMSTSYDTASFFFKDRGIQRKDPAALTPIITEYRVAPRPAS